MTAAEEQQHRVWSLLRENGYDSLAMSKDPLWGDVKITGMKNGKEVTAILVVERLTAMTDDQILEWLGQEFPA